MRERPKENRYYQTFNNKSRQLLISSASVQLHFTLKCVSIGDPKRGTSHFAPELLQRQLEVRAQLLEEPTHICLFHLSKEDAQI